MRANAKDALKGRYRANADIDVFEHVIAGKSRKVPWGWRIPGQRLSVELWVLREFMAGYFAGTKRCTEQHMIYGMA